VDAARSALRSTSSSTAPRGPPFAVTKTIVLQADGDAFALESRDDLNGVSGQIAVFFS
jgi:hypothetical protein